ncbi:MAG: tRNA (adenosine(37)-N6)-threonylcarbamoyltransferase complex ATPase subunit type 1 TsaE [Candidatus Omnitrophica bacterium CG1_02_49_10]|nr:MAG: tRNA (adenosine(37)-N6)-threonylcarbamoyltransferase complex ATPase subunit type 1 TsaE [Candidatus Omnitrophica bacterium CG1_02_49_10]
MSDTAIKRGRFISHSEGETKAIAAKLSKSLHKGSLLALCGELGSGKTVFTKGVAEGLGVKDTRYVSSPSFVIIREYKGRLPIYHFDLYRLTDRDDMETAGYGEYFYGGGVSVVEWADKIKDVLPKGHIRVDFEVLGTEERRITIT